MTDLRAIRQDGLVERGRAGLPALGYRRLAILVTAGQLGAIAVSWASVLPEILNQWGEDYQWFVDMTRRWVETGIFYNPHQLAGPYEAGSGVDMLYPPVALFLFVPFVWLPAFLWWIIPLGVLTWHVATARPQWWAWPLLALLVFVPRSQSIVIWGSTGMWIAAFVALGLRFAWASPFVLLKPSFAPFALIGITRRQWWVGAAALAGLSLLVLPMWPDFVAVMRNNVGPWPGLFYSVPDVPFMLVPVVAWWGRSGQVRSTKQ